MFDIGFIGMGHMGSAMLKGALKAFDGSRICFSRKDSTQGKYFAEETGTVWMPSNRECAANSKLLILAVKPQFYEEVCQEIRQELSTNQIIISLAPGWSIERLKSALGDQIRIIRAMPNTPALVGEAMTGISWSKDDFDDEEKALVQDFFKSFGRVETVPENLMDAVTAASGSSPAFFYMMMEAMADGVVKYGMPRQQAYTFVAQAVLGSARMLLETGEHPGKLKDDVCSPGGSTIAAVAALEANGFRHGLIEAVSAVCDRCRQI